MSYSGVFGGVSGATDETHLIPVQPAPTAPIRQTAAPSVMAPAPYRATAVEQPTSIVTPDCADYQYVVSYKPLGRTGTVRAGTPVVAGRKISWDSSIVGADFPKSWVSWRNGNAGDEQARVGLTTATKAFLIGFSLLGPNDGVLYVGAVSTLDVPMEKMQDFLSGLLRTPKRVEPPTLGLVAYAVVPPKAGLPPLPSVREVSYPARIGPTYSVNVARQVAVSAAIAKKEALVAMISGEIFGGLAVRSSQDLIIPGEREVLAALAALSGVPGLTELPASATAAMATLVAEAEAAKSMAPEDGDKAVADVLARIAAMQTAVAGDLSGKRAALAAGAASLAGAQAAASAYAGQARATEAEVRRLVQDKINLVESRPAFTALSAGEKHAVHCIMLTKAAPLIASRVAVAQPRVDALVSISPADFATAVANASVAYDQAISSVDAIFAAATAKAEAIRKQIALDWYARDFHGLPVWMWGAGGAVVLLGGALVVRKLKSKKAT